VTRQETSRVVNELFDSWYNPLVRYAWRRTGDLDLSEDLVQEVLLELCRELRKGRKIQSMKGWTLRVLSRRVARHLFPNGTRRVFTEPLEDLEPEKYPSLWVHSSAGELAEQDLVMHYLSKLSSREEEIVVLRMEGLKYREIAEYLGISVKAVGTFLARAIYKLKRERGRHVSGPKLLINAADEAKQALQ